MRHLLVMPSIRSATRVDRHQRGGIEVVARATGIVHLRTRIADAEEQQAAFIIERGDVPDGTTTVFPRMLALRRKRLLSFDIAVQRHSVRCMRAVFAFPTTGFRASYGVEFPDALAAGDVEGGEKSDASVLSRQAHH